MFGAPQGFIAYDQDQRVQALTKLANTQNQIGQFKLAEQKRMMQILAGQARAPVGQDGKPTPTNTHQLVDSLRSRGQSLVNAGFQQQGLALMKQADEMLRDDAYVSGVQATAKYHQDMAGIKQGEQLNNLLAGVFDKQSFDSAKMVWMSQHPGVPIPSILQTYSPTIIQALREGTKQGIAVLKKEQGDAALALRDKAQKEKAAHDAAAEQAAKDRNRIAEERVRQIAKAAGRKVPSVGTPNSAMIGIAQSFIAKDYPNLTPDLSLGGKSVTTQAAFDIASQGKLLMLKNHALTATQAIGQAYAAAKEKGEFKDIAGDPWYYGPFGKPAKDVYTPTDSAPGTVPVLPGRGPTMALPLPPEASGLVKGMWYLTPQGPGLWNGKTMHVESK